jgi:hypothetical protein
MTRWRGLPSFHSDSTRRMYLSTLPSGRLTAQANPVRLGSQCNVGSSMFRKSLCVTLSARGRKHTVVVSRHWGDRSAAILHLD